MADLRKLFIAEWQAAAMAGMALAACLGVGHVIAGCVAQAGVKGVDISPDLKLDIAPEIKPQATPTVTAATGDGGTVNQYTLTVASAGWGGLATVLALLAGWRAHHWKRAAERCVAGIETGNHPNLITEHIRQAGTSRIPYAEQSGPARELTRIDRTERYIRHAIARHRRVQAALADMRNTIPPLPPDKNATKA